MKFLTFGIAVLTALLASTIAPAAQAQVKITGGNGTITGGRIFVPTTGRFIGPGDRGTEENSLLYNGSYKGVLIKTELGNLPTNLLFRANLVPSFNTSAGEAPVVGTRGEVSGLVSFRALTNGGRPVFYNNIPTSLNIQLTAVPCPACSKPTTEWNAFDYRLTEVGVGETPSSRTVVTRETDVRLLQYQDRGDGPVDRTVLGTSVPASAYNVRRNGESYGGDVKFDIRSGTFGDGNINTTRLVEVLANPNTPTNPTNPTNPNPTTERPTTERPIVIGILPVIITTPRGSNTTWYTVRTMVYNPMLDQDVRILVRGRTRTTPNTPKPDNKPKPDNTPKPDETPKPDNTPKPDETPKPDDKKTEEVEIDTEQIVFVDNKTQRTYTTVGLPSRVFPNFMGLEEVDLKKD
jgi:hypothetical protein